MPVVAIRTVPNQAEAAHKWYFVALSKQGYGVEFDDQNHRPPAYGGPVGDFRNEAMVSDLIDELGFERVRELDAEITAWLRRRGGA